MSVRAKFKVASINRYWRGRDEIQTIGLDPVTGGTASSAENQSFWAATPSGKIELGCLNKAAAEQFELGREYYVTFDLVETSD